MLLVPIIQKHMQSSVHARLVIQTQALVRMSCVQVRGIKCNMVLVSTIIVFNSNHLLQIAVKLKMVDAVRILYVRMTNQHMQ